MKKVIIVIAVVLFIWKCDCSNNSNLSGPIVESNEWFKGGTLHKAKIIDWKSATERNKLATCADFVYSINKDLLLSEVKSGATDLKICIDGAVKDYDVVDQSEISEIAALCLTLLNDSSWYSQPN